MEIVPAGVGETRIRILRTAGEVFAEKGFRQATVREICSRAGVNIAAVNYHFGGKEALYIQTIEYWRDIAFAKNPAPDIEDRNFADPEDRLREFIRGLVFRVLEGGDASLFARLIVREHIEPTRPFDILVEQLVKPYFSWLSSLVARLASLEESTDTVRLCCASIVGQCLYFHYAKPVFQRLMDKNHFDRPEIEAVAEHIYRFTIGGLRQVEGRGRSAR